VVTFEGIGTCDIVAHRQNGYLAEHDDAEDIASGIEWCLGQSAEITAKCRDVVLSEYTLELQARRYERIYNSLVSVDGVTEARV
jgi:glycosyltransferase involved in cell wall biosynthesis